MIYRNFEISKLHVDLRFKFLFTYAYKRASGERYSRLFSSYIYQSKFKLTDHKIFNDSINIFSYVLVYKIGLSK